MATYPYKQTAMLSNDITATTTVTLQSGMQVATTVYTGSAGDFGTIILSPVHKTATDVTFYSGKQVLIITIQTFRAAFGFTTGQVMAVGSATDQDGKDSQDFSQQICEWS